MNRKLRKVFASAFMLVPALAASTAFADTADASGNTASGAASGTTTATNDPIAVVNNLASFIFTLTRAVGIIMLVFGIVQFGISLKNHDPSSRANALLVIAGGLVVTMAKEILGLIGVTF